MRLFMTIARRQQPGAFLSPAARLTARATPRFAVPSRGMIGGGGGPDMMETMKAIMSGKKMPGMPDLDDIKKILADPEIRAMMADPKYKQIFEEAQKGGFMGLMKNMGNPDFQEVMKKIREASARNGYDDKS